MKVLDNYRYQPINLQEQNETISVIIPAYNVREWISNAVESVLSQTYKNLEVILIDDASDDGTAEVCDQYALKDDRVYVIHNSATGGVGEARNKGLQKASGEFISFIDSDDWIENYMYEAMLSAIYETDSDMAICRHKAICPQGIKDGSTKKAILFEGSELIEKYVLTCEGLRDDEVLLFGAVWNKLFKRSMLGDIRFQNGIHEDMQVSFQLMARSNKTVYLDQGFYNYRINREGSLMKQNAPIARWKLFIERRSEVSAYLGKINRPDLAATWDYYSCLYLLDYYRMAFREESSIKDSTVIRKELSRSIRRLFTEDVRKKAHPIDSGKERFLMRLFLLSPKLFLCITESKTLLRLFGSYVHGLKRSILRFSFRRF